MLSDELNHASIIDGIRLCRAKRLRYKHMDLGDLENKLKESQVCVCNIKLLCILSTFTPQMHGCDSQASGPVAALGALHLPHVLFSAHARSSVATGDYSLPAAESMIISLK